MKFVLNVSGGRPAFVYFYGCGCYSKIRLNRKRKEKPHELVLKEIFKIRDPESVTGSDPVLRVRISDPDYQSLFYTVSDAESLRDPARTDLETFYMADHSTGADKPDFCPDYASVLLFDRNVSRACVGNLAL